MDIETNVSFILSHFEESSIRSGKIKKINANDLLSHGLPNTSTFNRQLLRLLQYEIPLKESKS